MLYLDMDIRKWLLVEFYKRLVGPEIAAGQAQALFDTMLADVRQRGQMASRYEGARIDGVFRIFLTNPQFPDSADMITVVPGETPGSGSVDIAYKPQATYAYMNNTSGRVRVGRPDAVGLLARVSQDDVDVLSQAQREVRQYMAAENTISHVSELGHIYSYLRKGEDSPNISSLINPDDKFVLSPTVLGMRYVSSNVESIDAEHGGFGTIDLTYELRRSLVDKSTRYYRRIVANPMQLEGIDTSLTVYDLRAEETVMDGALLQLYPQIPPSSPVRFGQTDLAMLQDFQARLVEGVRGELTSFERNRPDVRELLRTPTQQ